MMSSPGGVLLPNSDQKDLDKFTKYLAMKAVQVVVQARLGERVSVASKPDTSGGTSWFNLAVKDNHEVMQETKRAMGGSIPAPGLPLVCEISLKTTEGDSMVLEWWRLSVISGGDPQVKITHTVYNRMSLLLKSLVTVARVTPAYRLSRRQGMDSYVICYRVFLGDPMQSPDLGEGALTAKVGQVTTPNSTIVCSVDYRTNMTITQKQKITSQPILVKSDHFQCGEAGVQEGVGRGRGTVPSGARPRTDSRHRQSDCESDAGCGMTSDDSQENSARIFATSPLDRPEFRPRTDSGGSISSQERFRVGAFAGGPDTTLPSLEEELAHEPLLQLLPRTGRPNSTISVTSGETVSNTSVCTDTETQFLMSSDSGSKVKIFPGESPKVVNRAANKTATKGVRNLTELLDQEKTKEEATAVSGIIQPTTTGTRQGLTRRTSGGSLFGTSEISQDFVMVDLKTPFAQQPAAIEGASNTSDPTLGSFFKEVSSAPVLNSLPVAGVENQLDMWSSQLNSFEASLAEYDDLLNQIGSGSEAE